jgi:hypothetical protein
MRVGVSNVVEMLYFVTTRSPSSFVIIMGIVFHRTSAATQPEFSNYEYIYELSRILEMFTHVVTIPRLLFFWFCVKIVILMKPCVYNEYHHWKDRLCGLVVRVPGYRSRRPGSIPCAARFSEK